MWFGKGSPKEEQKAAEDVAKMLNKENLPIKPINEGDETDEFWNILGGKGEYSTLTNIKPGFKVRLFGCDNSRGIFQADEILDWTEDDLDTDQVAILDAYNEVYVWAGHGSRIADRKLAMETGLEYIKLAPDKRVDCQCLTIDETQESLNFTRHFQAWQQRIIKVFTLNNSAKQASTPQLINATSPTPTRDVSPQPRRDVSPQPKRAADVLAEQQTVIDQFFPYEQLKKKKDLPKTVDQSKLDLYLNPEEFPAVFGCTKEEYLTWTPWKRLNTRKEKQLF